MRTLARAGWAVAIAALLAIGCGGNDDDKDPDGVGGEGGDIGGGGDGGNGGGGAGGEGGEGGEGGDDLPADFEGIVVYMDGERTIFPNVTAARSALEASGFYKTFVSANQEVEFGTAPTFQIQFDGIEPGTYPCAEVPPDPLPNPEDPEAEPLAVPYTFIDYWVQIDEDPERWNSIYEGNECTIVVEEAGTQTGDRIYGTFSAVLKHLEHAFASLPPIRVEGWFRATHR